MSSLLKKIWDNLTFFTLAFWGCLFLGVAAIGYLFWNWHGTELTLIFLFGGFLVHEARLGELERVQKKPLKGQEMEAGK